MAQWFNAAGRAFSPARRSGLSSGVPARISRRTASSSGKQAIAGADGGTLVVGSYQEPTVYDPANMSAWQHPDAIADASINVNFVREFAREGENAKSPPRGTTDAIKHSAAERSLTLHGVALEAATPRHSFAGTSEQCADGLQAWVDARATDGFIVRSGTPLAFTEFARKGVPPLSAAGAGGVMPDAPARP